jgi:hypothetical protein
VPHSIATRIPKTIGHNIYANQLIIFIFVGVDASAKHLPAPPKVLAASGLANGMPPPPNASPGATLAFARYADIAHVSLFASSTSRVFLSATTEGIVNVHVSPWYALALERKLLGIAFGSLKGERRVRRSDDVRTGGGRRTKGRARRRGPSEASGQEAAMLHTGGTRRVVE